MKYLTFKQVEKLFEESKEKDFAVFLHENFIRVYDKDVKFLGFERGAAMNDAALLVLLTSSLGLLFWAIVGTLL